MATKNPIKEPLYQVRVETTDGEVIPVSPKMGKPACEKILEAVSVAIIKRIRKEWSNPHMVPVTTH